MRYSDYKWHEVYDFIEFVAQNLPSGRDRFILKCNIVLESELSPYRFVGGQLAELTDNLQGEALERVIAATAHGVLSGVSEHLSQAITLFSERKAPDYRNSIKESISAVETAARVITGKPKATLGDALKVIDDKVSVHKALQKGFSAIYGYTSDQGGIRHSIIDASTPVEAEDARYMLVACSAFVGYLIEKATKAGVLT